MKMYINKKDFLTLQKIATDLQGENLKALLDILQRISAKQNEVNAKTWELIKAKRKSNPMYARSAKEKENYTK